MDFFIRQENKKDYEYISKLVSSAFGRDNEAKLIEDLRKTKKFVSALSLVAEDYERIIGHILFYPVKIKGEQEFDILSLAPVSVLPDHQNMGVGSKMIEEGLRNAEILGFRSVLVIGHPNYYPKFGFEPAKKWGITAPFSIPDEAFLAIELTPDALKNVGGIVEFPEEYKKSL